MNNFSMLRDLVMIYPVVGKRQEGSGIIVTSLVDKTAPREGVVVAVGPGKINEDTLQIDPMAYKFGDRVIYVMANLTEVKHEKELFHVIPAAEILCKLEIDKEIV